MATPIPTENTQTANWLPFLLQTADPLFPTGAYAHSFGLEEMVRLNCVSSETSLGDFLTRVILPSLEEQELPHLRFAWNALPDVDALCEIDREIHATKIAAESRDASIQIGTRRLRALQVIDPSPTLRDFESRIKSREAHGHHISVFALQAFVGGIPIEAAMFAFGYQSLSGACAAALKLIRIGQDGCQRVLSRALALLPDALGRSKAIERDQAGCFLPLLEIASMRHASANERLFIS